MTLLPGRKFGRSLPFLLPFVCCLVGCRSVAPRMNTGFADYTLDYATPTHPALQSRLESLDSALRTKFGMSGEQTAVGVLDLRRLRLAMIQPDRIEYAASVPKVAILLAWFERNPEAATNLTPQTRHELGLMIKVSSNEMAAKYSRALGLPAIRQTIESYGFYDPRRGGGIWAGKHYGQGGERVGDAVGDHSHAATIRQLLRFYLLLEQGKLGSPNASQTMRGIFASPDIPHQQTKFVQGLAGRDVEILRKSGSWQNWLHDSAIIRGADRHYILAAMTNHPRGDDYLVELAAAVDSILQQHEP